MGGGDARADPWVPGRAQGIFHDSGDAAVHAQLRRRGFWGRVQDTSPSLWQKIPSILGESSPQGQYNAAGGSSLNFLTNWGSSFFNVPASGPDWSDSSPQPSPYSGPANVIPGSGELLAAPYTTSQYTIDATQPLERITVSPPADALLGQKVNRTNLTGVLFCAGAAPSCQCPPG